MTTRVKVCGLTTEEDLHLAVEAGADAVGIVSGVPVETPREVAPGRATALASATPPFVTSVLVTMPETPEDAIELARTVEPDAIQVHGDIDRSTLEAIRRDVGGPLLFALDAETVDAETIATRSPPVDAFVVDSTNDDGAGGTGETHDWTRTRTLTDALDAPVVLAGGLTPANVVEAVRTARPFAVDVASGVETRPGRKDPTAVETFVTRAGSATAGSRSSDPRSSDSTVDVDPAEVDP